MLADVSRFGFILLVSLLPGGAAMPPIREGDFVDGGGHDPLPPSAQVILEHVRPSCGAAKVPFVLEARIALMCHFIESVYQDCLGSQEPMFVGRGCRGQRCALDFARPDAVCLYTAYGQEVHPSKKSLEWTCGLETDDPDFDYQSHRPLPPAGEPLFDDPALRSCGQWLPQGISGVEWTECVGGMPIAKIELTFEADMPSDVDYHCLLAPMCGDSDYIQNIVCYVDLNDVDEGQAFVGNWMDAGIEEDAKSGVAALGLSPILYLHTVWGCIFVAVLLL